jgi:hypothetical protein
MSKPIKDLSKFKDITKRGRTLKASFSARDKLFESMDDMYLMDWGNPKQGGEQLGTTISPTARNSTIGAVRLVAAAVPMFKVEPDEKDVDADAANQIEDVAKVIWAQSSAVTGVSIHRDLALAAFLYAHPQAAVVLTEDLLEMAKGGSKASIRRAELVAEKTPALIRSLRPHVGYVQRDMLGMRAYYRAEEIDSGTIKNIYGAEAEKQLSSDDTRKVTLCEWWDLEYHAVWVDGSSAPLIFEEHELPFIPIASAISEGSELFDDVQYRFQPFLYTLNKSGLWDAQNLALTAGFQAVKDYGVGPLYKYVATDDTSQLVIDYSGPVRYAKIRTGESLDLMGEKIVDPVLFQMFNMSRELDQQSTIYGQTLGEPLGSGAAFSTVSMLSQAGRLPLTGPTDAVGKVITDITRIAFEWMAERKIKHPLLDKIKLPRSINIEGKLEIKMPADMVRNGQLAMSMTQGENPPVSTEWVQSNLLQESDPARMRRQILKERAYAALANAKIQQYVQSRMQAQQPQQPGAPGQPPAGPGGMPAGLPPMPPEMSPQGQAGPLGPAQGVPMTEPMQPGGPGGLPPMMQGA